MNTYSVGIAITVCRRYEYIFDYIAAIKNYHGDVQVVVVNIDGDKQIPHSVSIPGCSYAHAVNVGIRQLSTDIVIFSNDDIVVSGPFVDILVEPILRRKHSIVGPKLLNGYLEGYMVAMHRDAWEHIGGMDERFPGCYEDVDFSRTAQRLGYELVEVDIPTIKHIDLGQLDHKVNDSLREYRIKWQS